MATACVLLMELPPEQLKTLINERDPPLINVGSGKDLTIRELAERVRTIVGSQVSIEWDSTKPDGTPRKLLDVSKLTALGWRPTVALVEGIRRAYADYLGSTGR